MGGFVAVVPPALLMLNGEAKYGRPKPPNPYDELLKVVVTGVIVLILGLFLVYAVVPN
jgi:hypothetical protein